ncbi:MAG: PAS domain S-box protein [Desulfobulbus sp.]
MNKQSNFFPPTRRASFVLALYWLLLCGVAIFWCYKKELQASREEADQRLTLIARADVAQLESYRRRVLAEAETLSHDPFFASAVSTYLTDGRQEELLRARLKSLRDQGHYRDILLADPGGAVHMRLAEPDIVPLAAMDTLLKRRPTLRPSFLVLDDGQAGSLPIISVSTSIFKIDRWQDTVLATIVLLSALPEPKQLFPDICPDTSQLLVVHRDQAWPLTLEQGKKRQFSGGHPAEGLFAKALRSHSLPVRGVDHRGIDSLAVTLQVPDSDWLVFVAQPIGALADPWNYRASGLLLFCWLAGTFTLLRSQNQRRQVEELGLIRDRHHRLQQQQHGLLHSSREGILIVDEHNLIQEINPIACRLTGWHHEEAIGRTADEVFPLIDGRGSVLLDLQPGAITPATSPILLTREGREMSIALVIAPCTENDTGGGDRIVSFYDRSEESLSRRRVESRLLLREYAYTHGVHELLHRAMQELATLVASPRGFCCSLDIPLCAVAVERSTQSEPGQPWSWYDAEGEPICSSLQEWLPDLPSKVTIIDPSLHHQDQAQGTDSPAEPGCRFGQVREILLPLHRAGRLAAVMVLADKPRSYSAADVDTVVQIGEYIWRLVEQKQMEEALLASERRYRTLYRSMMDAFVVTDLSGRIRECNQAYANMLGFTPEELKGKSARDFTPKRWWALELEHVRKELMHGGCSELYEKEYCHRDGRVFPVELRTYLLVNNEGQPEGMSAVVRDISRRKQAEEERKKLGDRLNLAQKLESVGQLAGGVAHDFNNMLSVIIGFAELALRSMEVPRPLDMYLREIVTAAKRSADVTRQLLTFARQQTIVPKELDLNPTLEGMIKMLRRLIGENIELSWLPGEDIWPVKMDPSQINQLLANLCVNARDAIDGVGKITMETGKVSFDEAYCAERGGFLPGDFVMLAVSDTGSGIDRTILDKIFEPFFTTKAVGQGTGLGLATVYGIVKQNRGFINVYSEPGQGTTFRIYLPRHLGNIEQGAESELQSIPIGQGELVLVVEDEPAMLSLTQTLLEQLNYKVLTASKPGDALIAAREYGQAIDLVISDVIMPEMNGRDLVKEMSEFCPNAKILFMSGYTANVIAHRGELEVETRFLTKPFSTSELAWKARETLLG